MASDSKVSNVIINAVLEFSLAFWLGPVARKVDNFIRRIVIFSNFLNMFTNCYNPDKKSLFSS